MGEEQADGDIHSCQEGGHIEWGAYVHCYYYPTLRIIQTFGSIITGNINLRGRRQSNRYDLSRLVLSHLLSPLRFFVGRPESTTSSSRSLSPPPSPLLSLF